MPKIIKTLFLVLFPITISILFFLKNYNSSYSIFDANKYEIGFYCDEDEGGTSFVAGGKNENNKYWMEYTLGDEGYEYPYAIMVISRKDSLPFIISKFDNMDFKLSSKSSSKLNVSAYVYLDGYTILNDNSTYLPLVFEVSTSSKLSSYSLNFEDFKIPRWWYLENDVTDPKSIKYSLGTIMYFTISSSIDKETGIKDHIEIEDLKIRIDIISIFEVLIKFLLIYYSIAVLLILLLKNVKRINTNKVISYKSLDFNKEFNEENIIVEYIGINYSDPDLSLTKIADNVDLSIKQISVYINKTYKLSFPEYLNLIRINEAKKILQNTDNKIVDIAISVGFNSAGHFNRVFKNLESCTPSFYRKENRSTITI